MTGTTSENPPPRTARDANRAELQTRLLDTAEKLFADRGYFGVSIRDITDGANTRLASVSEQFGGKESLFQAVLARRIRPLNDDRRARLAKLPGRGARAVRLRVLIDAFTEPMRCRSGNPGWDNYFRLIAQLANSGHSIGRLIVDDFNTIAADFIAQLHTLFPEADEVVVQDAYLHLVAAAMHTYSNNLRLDSLTGGRMHTHDIAERHQALLSFAEGGITATVTRSP
ncbi:TetR/AcrR family transcriptional regulator [Rhodococcus sp. IEGM 1381]|uniref:TetR/AcrR family transcriptional regulator n=1 Tax=Rhodococcus sp. IEGM 1381 TaxID=3047085 RepID=UPI0024B6B7B8|nr:TetR/AcrR family transcriptional regulator [Rhodococcus sp. IEGM 1381]MDI9897444.1 TetR/AcrR family transcriptional regulator [Rhodococcus sp. IEGM 1381]